MLQPYDAYCDTDLPWLESIPLHWSTRRCSDYFYENKNSNTKLAHTNALQFRFGEIVSKKKFEIDTDLAQTYRKYTIAKAGDIAINGLNLNYDFVTKRIAIVRDTGILTSAYIVVSAKENMNAEYACYLFKYMDSRKIFHGMGTGIRLTLAYPEFKNIKIPVPPYEEQGQIVCYLDWKLSQIQKLINAKRKQIALLKEQKQAMIDKAVTKGLNPNAEMKDSGIEWIGQIPKTWENTRLRNFSTAQNGISEAGDFFTAGFPFVSYGDVYNHYQLPASVSGLAKSNSKQQETYSVQKGDIFFTRTSETIDEIGFSSVCMRTIEHAIFSGFLIRVRPIKNILDNHFAKYYFRSSLVREYFSREMNLVTRASLGQTMLHNLPVLLPSLEEQHSIGAYLEEKAKILEAIIAKTQQEISLIDEYRTRLIADIVTGRVDVRGIEIPLYETEEATGDTAGIEYNLEEPSPM